MTCWTASSTATSTRSSRAARSWPPATTQPWSTACCAWCASASGSGTRPRRGRRSRAARSAASGATRSATATRAEAALGGSCRPLAGNPLAPPRWVRSLVRTMVEDHPRLAWIYRTPSSNCSRPAVSAASLKGSSPSRARTNRRPSAAAASSVPRWSTG